MGKQWKQWETLFGGGSKSLQMVTATTKLKDTCSLGKKVMTNLDSILKSRDVTLLTKVHLVKATVFPVVMYGCEIWTIENAERQRIDALELWCCRRLFWESPVLQGYQTSQSKGNQPWIFIGRTDVKAEAPILWPPDEKSQLTGKDLNRGKDWGQEEKGTTEDEMVR